MLKQVNQSVSHIIHIINTYADPSTVPRIVWGLKNLQKASLNCEILSNTGSDPAVPT